MIEECEVIGRCLHFNSTLILIIKNAFTLPQNTVTDESKELSRWQITLCKIVIFTQNISLVVNSV